METALANVIMDRPATDLDRLLDPRGIAVIGASPETAKLSGRPIRHLTRYGYGGAIHPVNPRHDTIGGLKCYADIADVPDPVDLAVVMVPARLVVEAVEAVGRRGIPFAIIVASGFSESGNVKEQEELVRIAERFGTRLIGPNCVGLVSPHNGVTATFSTVLLERMPPAGGLALATQSGALGNSLLQSFCDLGIGLRHWISTGNEADLDVLEFAEHAIDDPQVHAIALFIEGLKDGHRLIEIGRRAIAARKPVYVVRAGISDQGREASVSHTGKLAGSARVWRDVALQAGIVEFSSLDGLLDCLLARQAWFAGHQPRKPSAEIGLGVLTVSGGLGVLVSDYAEACGIRIPPFTDETDRALRTLLPPQMSVANPVDTALFADADGYARCAELVMGDRNIDVLVLVLTSLAHEYDSVVPWLERLASMADRLGKQIAVTYLSSSDTLDPQTRNRLLAAGVLVIPTAERLVAAIEKAFRHAGPAADIAASDLPSTSTSSRPAQDEILEAAGIGQPAQRLARSAQEAAAAAGEIGFPVVLKIESPDIAHKTEIGGVTIGLDSAETVKAAWEEMTARARQLMPDARIDGCLVQEMVTNGVEMILGCSHDPELGPVAMLGAGGIWAEVFDDAVFLAAPCTSREIAAALDRLKTTKILQGARGRPRMDIDALVACTQRLARLFAASRHIAEIDINPLVVREQGKGCVAVDFLCAERDQTGMTAGTTR